MTINNISDMNTHSLIISTEKNSVYHLYEKNGETYFIGSCGISGKIIKVHEEIKVGGSFHIDFCKYNIYDQLQDSTMLLHDFSPITSITPE